MMGSRRSCIRHLTKLKEGIFLNLHHARPCRGGRSYYHHGTPSLSRMCTSEFRRCSSSKPSTVKNKCERKNSTSTKDTKEEESDPGSIYNPPDYDLPVSSSQVRRSIRSSLVGAGDRSLDTGMSLIFLGTSAGLPSKMRSPTATLLRLGGESILVDAGEGTQRQLMFSGARPTQIQRIFITHLHGDHIFGLPGLLLGLQHSFQLQGKSQEEEEEEEDSRVVKIYGPPGLYNYIASNVIFSCTLFHAIQVEVYELVGGRVQRAHGTRQIRNPFATNYPEFNFGKVMRYQLPCGPDGIWTIEDLSPMRTREAVLAMGDVRKLRPNFRIQAAEVDHLSGVATFGYSIEEEEWPRNIDAVKARELGVSAAGKKFSLLKAGFSVLTDDGSREVQPCEVLKEQKKKARKVTIVGDNRGWTASMKRVAANSDILVHEATLLGKEGTDWRKRGHSTAEMAGKLSGEMNAKLLILNHVSPKADFSDEGAQLKMMEDATKASKNTSEVVVAYDFMEVVVPWLGFGNTEETFDMESQDQAGMQPQPDGAVDTKQVLKKWFGDPIS